MHACIVLAVTDLGYDGKYIYCLLLITDIVKYLRFIPIIDNSLWNFSNRYIYYSLMGGA